MSPLCAYVVIVAMTIVYYAFDAAATAGEQPNQKLVEQAEKEWR